MSCSDGDNDDMGATLSSPITEKETFLDENQFFKIGSSSMQGWRISMEDSHSVLLEPPEDPMASYFGVFDGHGGSGVAKFAGENLLKFITGQDAYKKGNIAKAIESGFMEIDAKMKEDKDLAEEMSGSTAVIVLVKNKRVYCGNAGDSRAIAYVKDGVIALSYDHKPFETEEHRRIHEAGGWVEANRVNGNLAVSRALGDFVFKMDGKRPAHLQAVIALPDVRVEEMTNDWKFILLACDGIWDVMTNEEVGQFVYERLSNNVSPDVICEELMMRCLATSVSPTQVGCDNMTVILVQILKVPDYSTPLASRSIIDESRDNQSEEMA